ncbi:MAG: ASKHA domain-containing protein [Oscillospiraceae bacterium]|jgi:uncharacterized 2Fe-2S/4Fe-4S cluster protein (DUF4445 family)|nr:ASKHA domain-containing protein [Oscillospiraceae bacterium]
MPEVKVYRSGALIARSESAPGVTILKHLSDAGIFLDAPCGGRGRCGKCLVRLSPDGAETRACQTSITGDMDVYIPGEMEMEIAGDDAAAKGATVAADEPLGVAVDIGTTTVVAHLTSLRTGIRAATASGVNAQRPYGADVISRIQYCASNGHEQLTALIRGQLRDLITRACADAGADPRGIEYISIAGNTIMEHLAAGLSPVGMGVAPFRPLSLFGDETPVWDDLGVAHGATVYFAPAISSYVGGDITAGMLSAGLEDTEGPCVYIDIGTNGEIAMKLGERYLCCATAAGPAFEGAEISMGMAAVPGAVNHVVWEDGAVKYTTIGGAPAEGLCGSGLLDALALLVRQGAVDETGRLLPREETSGAISEYLESRDGKNIFRLARGCKVYMDYADVRKLQLAKSAIAAGIQTLLTHAGIDEGGVRAFVLAGGFGSFMDKDSAAAIGLFPKIFLPATRAVGNTAGEGAALALRSAEARATLGAMRERCEYIELSTSSVFNEQFVEQMMF